MRSAQRGVKHAYLVEPSTEHPGPVRLWRACRPSTEKVVLERENYMAEFRSGGKKESVLLKINHADQE